MPIYEYRRPDGTTFELVQSFSDEPLTVDPETGVPLARVFHPPALHFKGKGFYNTDYGTRKRQRENAAAESSSDSSSDSKAPVSAESGSSGGDGKGAKDTKSDSSSNGAGKSTGPAGGAKEKPAKPVAAKK